MKRIVYLLGQSAADARNTAQVLDTGACHFLHAAELFKELLPAPRSYPGNCFQRRHRARPCAPLPVAGNCEPVRLVAYLLYQVQCRRAGFQIKAALLGWNM